MAPRFSRRRFLATAAATAGALSGCAGDDGNGDDGDGPGNGSPTPTDGPSLELATETIASGFTSPVDVVSLDDRFLVADQPGELVLVDGDDRSTALDVRDRTVDVGGYDERGLLGVATHPDVESNGRCFVRYSAPPRDGTPDGYSHTFVLSEFRIEPGSGAVDRASERPILEIPQPQSNHNAGDVAFGPDGYLYVPVGDGGRAGDQGPGHVQDWYEGVGGGNGQDVTENLLGSLLRIDVDGTDGDRPYGIPSDNPLVGEPGLDEHYAWGLRNPWRLSFGPEGRCLAADVGQDRFEEVNLIERGGNYGWNVREGTACYGASECPTVTDDGERLRPPVVQYGREGPVSGIAVVGGHLYRGSALPALRDRYVFGDWQAGGRLFVATEADSGLWSTGTLPVTGEDAVSLLLTFGEDPDGELLLGTTREAGVRGSTGTIERLVPGE
jgi:glucose/arabinose dehydrogenase